MGGFYFIKNKIITLYILYDKKFAKIKNLRNNGYEKR